MLSVKDTFAAAHRLESYHGKCENLHGHNFSVEALFEGEQVNEEGMLVDFAILKGYLKEVLEELDHTFINEIPFFRERASSSAPRSRARPWPSTAWAPSASWLPTPPWPWA